MTVDERFVGRKKKSYSFSPGSRRGGENRLKIYQSIKRVQNGEKKTKRRSELCEISTGLSKLTFKTKSRPQSVNICCTPTRTTDRRLPARTRSSYLTSPRATKTRINITTAFRGVDVSIFFILFFPPLFAIRFCLRIDCPRRRTSDERRTSTVDDNSIPSIPRSYLTDPYRVTLVHVRNVRCRGFAAAGIDRLTSRLEAGAKSRWVQRG